MLDSLGRRGLWDAVLAFEAETGLAYDASKRDLSARLAEIVSDIEAGNLDSALEWCEANKAFLAAGPHPSALPYHLHRAVLLAQPTPAAAVEYARTHMFEYLATQPVLELVTSRLFMGKESPYEIENAPLASMFRTDYCRCHGWAREDPLEVAVDLGSRGGALNAIEKARKVMGDRLGNVRTWPELPVSRSRAIARRDRAVAWRSRAVAWRSKASAHRIRVAAWRVCSRRTWSRAVKWAPSGRHCGQGQRAPARHRSRCRAAVRHRVLPSRSEVSEQADAERRCSIEAIPRRHRDRLFQQDQSDLGLAKLTKVGIELTNRRWKSTSPATDATTLSSSAPSQKSKRATRTPPQCYLAGTSLTRSRLIDFSRVVGRLLSVLTVLMRRDRRGRRRCIFKLLG